MRADDSRYPEVAMIVFNVFAALVMFYRWRHRLLTRGEVLLIAVWVAHGLLVEAQLFAELGRIKVEWRYLDPANVFLWLEAAWGLAKLWSFARGRLVIAVVLAGFALTNGAMVIKHLFPVGRRARIVSVCREAARQIRDDWQGPARDEHSTYSAKEYHSDERPVVQGPHSFKSAQRLLGTLSGGRTAKQRYFPVIDKPDYWLLDESEPRPESAMELSTLSHGNHRYVLYRRMKR